MGEVEGDAILGGRHDLPNAVLVHGVQVGETGARDGAVGGVNLTATSVCGRKLYGEKFPEKNIK